jgi:hypothetical protein
MIPAVMFASVMLAGCSSGSAGQTSASTTAPHGTTTSVASATSSTSTTTANGARNLVASPAIKSGLLAAYLAHSGLAADQVVGTAPGSVYYAYLPSTQTYWAMAGFVPSSTASMQTQVSMQDEGCCGIFTQSSGAASWTYVSSYLGSPCPGAVPPDVIAVWKLQPGADCPGASGGT